jgi:hypothetical protein
MRHTMILVTLFTEKRVWTVAVQLRNNSTVFKVFPVGAQVLSWQITNNAAHFLVFIDETDRDTHFLLTVDDDCTRFERNLISNLEKLAASIVHDTRAAIFRLE